MRPLSPAASASRRPAAAPPRGGRPTPTPAKRKGGKRGGASAPAKPSSSSTNGSSGGGGGAPPVLASVDEELLPLRGAPVDDDDDDSLADGARFMDAVVKVYCVHTEPNFSLPWQRKRQFASTSSGFMIAATVPGQRWLLTNAHSVEYASQVRVKRRGDDAKFLARVLAVGTECDIALLTVDDDAFWEGVTPLEFGPLPRLQDPVVVVGHPVGGESLAIVSGVVSRIEVTNYVHGSTELLGCQVSAPINSGNSGGPALNRHGQCIGIAFQSMAGSDAENVGYIIPPPVAQRFLLDYARNSTFTNFPVLGIRWQRLESAPLRASYGMEPSVKGVLIRSVAPTAAAAAVLRADDVVTHFDGVAIANDGSVPFRPGERIAFGHLVSQKFCGETARVRVLRGGEALELDVPLSPPAPLVPLHLGGADPAYLVVAGLVFTPASEPYLQSEYGADYVSDSPVKLLDALFHGVKKAPDEQVVVLSQVLACDATLGYDDLFNVRVRAFNGTPVRNLAHLAAMVAAAVAAATADDAPSAPASAPARFLRFDLDYDEVIVLDAAAVPAATADMLDQHSIPAAASPGLDVAAAAEVAAAAA